MLSLGPVPLEVALAVVSLCAAIVVARCWPRANAADRRVAGAIVVDMALVGLLGARVLFILRNAAEYLASPVSMLRIGDGGFDVSGFVAAAMAWALFKLRTLAGPRRAVLAAALAGSACWWGAGALLLHWQAGKTAMPQIVLQDLHGDPVVLDATPGTPVVLNVWASWCGPCVREMPVLARAQARHPQVRFLFINQGEDAATVQGFVARHAPSLRNVLLDEASRTSTDLGVQAYPSTLFFHADGRLSELHLGELSAGAIEHKLGQLR